MTCVAVPSLAASAALRTCHDIVHADCRWKRYLYRGSGQEPVPEGRNRTLPICLPTRLVQETVGTCNRKRRRPHPTFVTLTQDMAMDSIVMKLEQNHDDDFPAGQWVEIASDHSPHQSPLHEYNGFGFLASAHVPLDSIYTRPNQTTYSSNPPLHPLIMPQWPSQITNPSEGGPPAAIPLPRVLAPTSAITTPQSAPAASSASASTTARKTLTDQDRRAMCQFHEDHPTVKQTEIGCKLRKFRSIWSL